MKLGFCILNFGSPELAVRACRAVLETASDADVVLVDNFSSAEHRQACRVGVAALEAEFARPCWFLGLDDNGGYGPGMNAGLAFLFTQRGVDVAFAVNSDVVVRRCAPAPDALRPDELELYCVTIREHGRLRLGASRFVAWFARRREARAQDLAQGGAIYPEGCLWGMSRALFAAAGGFSDAYFLYFEELDYIYRFRGQYGRFPRVRHLAGLEADHLHGGTTGMQPGAGRSTLAEFWSARGRILFFCRWQRGFLGSAVIYNGLLAVRALAWGRPDLARAVWRGGLAGALKTESDQGG